MTVAIVDQVSIPDPLTHAWIQWDNSFASAAATNAFSGSNPGGALNQQTFERARADGSVTGQIISITRGSTPVNCVAFAHRNLEGKSITVSASGAWSETFIVLSHAPVMVLAPQANVGTISVTINSPTTNPEISYISAGLALVMPRPIYGGHSPITLSRTVEKRPNMSQGGEFLGVSIYRKGVSTKYSWSNIKADDYRDDVDPWIESAVNGNSFFIAWRPEDYPSETAYGWLTNDPAPSNQGQRDLMELSVSMIGYVPR